MIYHLSIKQLEISITREDGIFFRGISPWYFDQLTLHKAHPPRIKETAHVGFAGNHGSGCAAGQSVAGREIQVWMAWQARKKQLERSTKSCQILVSIKTFVQ